MVIKPEVVILMQLPVLLARNSSEGMHLNKGYAFSILLNISFNLIDILNIVVIIINKLLAFINLLFDDYIKGSEVLFPR